MKKIISLSRLPTKQLVAEGKLQKIELYATTGDKFAERLAKFLTDVAKYTGGGASRDIGILDDSGAAGIRLSIDGDGADRIRDVKLVKP